MKEKKDKLGFCGWLFAGFVGVSFVVAAPVIGLAWLGTKGLEALGCDNTPKDDVNPLDL